MLRHAQHETPNTTASAATAATPAMVVTCTPQHVGHAGHTARGGGHEAHQRGAHDTAPCADTHHGHTTGGQHRRMHRMCVWGSSRRRSSTLCGVLCVHASMHGRRGKSSYPPPATPAARAPATCYPPRTTRHAPHHPPRTAPPATHNNAPQQRTTRHPQQGTTRHPQQGTAPTHNNAPRLLTRCRSPGCGTHCTPGSGGNSWWPPAEGSPPLCRDHTTGPAGPRCTARTHPHAATGGRGVQRSQELPLRHRHRHRRHRRHCRHCRHCHHTTTAATMHLQCAATTSYMVRMGTGAATTATHACGKCTWVQCSTQCTLHCTTAPTHNHNPCPRRFGGPINSTATPSEPPRLAATQGAGGRGGSYHHHGLGWLSDAQYPTPMIGCGKVKHRRAQSSLAGDENI